MPFLIGTGNRTLELYAYSRARKQQTSNAMLFIEIANLIIRVWEMRKDRRRNTDGPNQTGT